MLWFTVYCEFILGLVAMMVPQFRLLVYWQDRMQLGNPTPLRLHMDGKDDKRPHVLLGQEDKHELQHCDIPETSGAVRGDGFCLPRGSNSIDFGNSNNLVRQNQNLGSLWLEASGSVVPMAPWCLAKGKAPPV